jgi:translation initiation factor IF-2
VPFGATRSWGHPDETTLPATMTHRRPGGVVASPQPHYPPAGILACPLAAIDSSTAEAHDPTHAPGEAYRCAARTSRTGRRWPASAPATWRRPSAAMATPCAICARRVTWPSGSTTRGWPLVPGAAWNLGRQPRPAGGGPGAAGGRGGGPAPAGRAAGVVAAAAGGGRAGGPGPACAGGGPVQGCVRRRRPAQPPGGGDREDAGPHSGRLPLTRTEEVRGSNLLYGGYR